MAELDRLFKLMVEVKASDLHLASGCSPMWRLHGDMVPLQDAPVMGPELLMRLIKEILPPSNLKQYEEIHDTDFGYELPGFGRFRANIFMDRRGPGAVFRLIPAKIMTVEDLGLSRSMMKLCYLSKGLVLVTGPTGSGKSTTLAALIDFINRNRSAHIITVEDPIEFVHENKKCLINQREMYANTSSFKHALRAALREDPNIVLVGEMRDLETIEIAIETAETGHLVFGTLHTTTAASTVERIIEQFPEAKQNQIRQMLANSLKGVIAQALLKRMDGKGRVVAIEYLAGNPAVANLIREGKTHQIQSVIQTSGKAGMILLNDALLKLVTARVVSADDAYIHSSDKEDFQRKLAQSGISFDMSFSTSDVQRDNLRPVTIRAASAPSGAQSLSAITTASAAAAEMEEGEEGDDALRAKTVVTDDFQSFRQKMFKKNTQ
jgi:twitching motility protein PilT